MEELHVSAEELRTMNEALVEAGKAVETERKRYQELFEFAPDGYLVTDQNGIIQEVNRAAEALVHRSREFLRGKPLPMLVAAEQRKEFRKLINELRAGAEGDTPGREFRFRTRRKEMVDVALGVTATRDADGLPVTVRWLVRDITQQKLAEREIQKVQGALHRNREELRALASRLLTAQEEERRRLSRELHDDLNQNLALLAVEVESLEKELPLSPGKIRKQLRMLRDQVVELSDHVHTLAYGLHPSILDDLGLAIAVKSYVQDFSRREKSDIRFATRGIPPSLPPGIASCLYRVTQEGLRNVAKHARTRRCTVRLIGSGEGIQLSIKDFGVGFDPEASRNQGIGLGIVGMQERVRLVNGTFSIQSIPGRGTQILVRVPVKREEIETASHSAGR
jgi:PAS domain S-box-containing protein